VLLSSHILSEAEALADRLTIIRNGRTVETGTLADLRHLTRTSVDAETERPVSIAGLEGLHGATVVKASTAEGTRLRCEVDNTALEGLLRELTAAGVRALTCRPPTLEELFLRHYAGQPADSGRPGADQHSAGRQAPAGSSS
jgi:ABC-2 type transport system ATP-binding protein